MLQWLRSYQSAVALWCAIACLFVIGLLVLFPIYLDVDVGSQANAAKKYEPHNALYVAVAYARDALTSSGFWTAVATIVIATFTITLAKVGSRQSEDSRVIQRAYVRMSHTDLLNADNRKLNIEIRNTGHSPAKVVGARLGPVIVEKDEELPGSPPYHLTEQHPTASGFLHAGDFFIFRQGLDFGISQVDWGAVTRGEKTLYIVGFVEYVDVFGVWHRSGYARRYAHGRKHNNLPFAGGGDAYSYDIVISEGERLTGKQKQPDGEGDG